MRRGIDDGDDREGIAMRRRWKTATIIAILILAMAGVIILLYQQIGDHEKKIKPPSAQIATTTTEEKETSLTKPTGKTESADEELTFEEFNRLLDSIFQESQKEKGDKSPGEVGGTTAAQEPQNGEIGGQGKAEEKSARNENSTEETTSQIEDMTMNLLEYSIKYNDLRGGMLEASREKRYEEFYRLGDEMVETVREALSVARDLQKLAPDDVTVMVLKVDPDKLPPYVKDIPMINVFILVKESLGDKIPSLRAHLPIRIMTFAGIPEDENMSFSEMMKIGNRRFNLYNSPVPAGR